MTDRSGEPCICCAEGSMKVFALECITVAIRIQAELDLQ